MGGEQSAVTFSSIFPAVVHCKKRQLFLIGSYITISIHLSPKHGQVMKMINDRYSLLYGPWFWHFHLPPLGSNFFYDNAFTYHSVREVGLR